MEQRGRDLRRTLTFELPVSNRKVRYGCSFVGTWGAL